MSSADEMLQSMSKIQTAKWAVYEGDERILVDDGERSIKMCNGDGTGELLLALNGFGADIIRFAAGEGVMNHTHAGDHILFVIRGTGVVEYDGIEYKLYPGLSYLVPGNVDHAIRATQNLVLIAVGNMHRSLDSNERMQPTHK